MFTACDAKRFSICLNFNISSTLTIGPKVGDPDLFQAYPCSPSPLFGVLLRKLLIAWLDPRGKTNCSLSSMFVRPFAASKNANLWHAALFRNVSSHKKITIVPHHKNSDLFGNLNTCAVRWFLLKLHWWQETNDVQPSLNSDGIFRARIWRSSSYFNPELVDYWLVVWLQKQNVKTTKQHWQQVSVIRKITLGRYALQLLPKFARWQTFNRLCGTFSSSCIDSYIRFQWLQMPPWGWDHI